MNSFQLNTAVALFIFNRPEPTEKVFSAIAKEKPRKFFVIADGPRSNVPGDAERCESARKIIDRIDWECELLTNYSDENMGCRKRVSSGLDWVFESVEEAIILEDDCLPHPTFFRFCQELLEKYRNDSRIMTISGNNFQYGRKRTDFSYYYSRCNHIWGWASWRRSWEKYDVNMELWPDIRDERAFKDIFDDKKVRNFWIDAFNCTHNKSIDTWDHQFTFACLINKGLCILPSVNLVSNIGFGIDATRTKDASKLSEIPVKEMVFPLRHPPFVVRNKVADSLTEKDQYTLHSLPVKITNMIKQRLL